MRCIGCYAVRAIWGGSHKQSNIPNPFSSLLHKARTPDDRGKGHGTLDPRGPGLCASCTQWQDNPSKCYPVSNQPLTSSIACASINARRASSGGQVGVASRRKQRRKCSAFSM